jgi:TfoX/Sxy family transcriptional regulator of competence genes
MAYDIALNNRVTAIIAHWEGVEAKRMFGGICYLIHGNMFGGVYQDFLILRLGESAASKALMLPFVRPLDITGRPLKGWVMVAKEGVESDADLRTWLEKAKAFALSLPPK